MLRKLISILLFMGIILTNQYTYSGCFDNYSIALFGTDKLKIDELNIGLGENQKYEVKITQDDLSFLTPDKVIINSKTSGVLNATVDNGLIQLKGTAIGSADLVIDVPCPTGNISKTFKVNVVDPETMDHFDFGLIPRTEKIPNTANNYQYIKKTKRFKIDFGKTNPSNFDLFTCQLWLEAKNKNTQSYKIEMYTWGYFLYFDAQINTEFLPRGSNHVGTIEICSNNTIDKSYLIKSKVNVIVASSDTIVIDMQILSQDINVNGNPSRISANEVPRLIPRGGKSRTYIPLRLVANYCNMIVDYIDQPGIARISANDLSITVPIKPKAQEELPWVTRTQYSKPNKFCVENKEITKASFTTSYVGPSNVAATIVDGTGLIELRAILESFGAQVIWADGSKTIRIIYRPGWTSGI